MHLWFVMDIWSTIEYVYIYYFEFDIVNFEYGLQHFTWYKRRNLNSLVTKVSIFNFEEAYRDEKVTIECI